LTLSGKENEPTGPIDQAPAYPTDHEAMTDDRSFEERELFSYRDLRGADEASQGTLALAEPKRLGRYQIVAELGRGAMGMVYEAYDPRIDRVVAIKIITISGDGPSESEAFRTRFIREARASGRLSHPGIVTIYDVDEDPVSHTPYIVMEYVPGKRLDTFAEQLPSQRIPLETSLALAQQIAEALDYAHAQGIVHRDIKPGNVIVTEEGFAKIADFGIAKIALTEFTVPGQVLGTPSFMAPEQFLGAPVDGRSDLFSLGIILYWMLTGVKPFTGENAASVSFKLVYEDPTPATQIIPKLHPYFDAVLSHSLAKDPAARYQSGKEFALDLKLLRQGEAPKALVVPNQGPSKARVAGQRIGRAVSMVLSSVAARTMHARNQFLQHLPSRKWLGDGSRFGLRWRLGLATSAVLIAAIGFHHLVGVRTALGKQEGLKISKSVVEPSPATLIPATPASVPPAQAKHKSVRELPARVARTPTRKVLASVRTENAALTSAKVQPIATAQSIASVQPIAAVQSTVPAQLPVPAPSTAKATLLTIGEHSFRLATLSISVDGELAYRGQLTGVRRLPFQPIRGTVSEAIRLAPGSHVVEVHVVSEHDHCDETKTITGQFQANELKTLNIAFAAHNSDMRLAWK
jgi:serine/threonine protein kinase